MSTNLISRQSLWERLKNGVESRIRFVDSHLSKNLAFQIRGMREREGWSQEKLAEKVGMNQNAISRLENPYYGKPTLTTLKRIAAAFDVALVVRFVPFSHLVSWVSGTPFVDKGLSAESMTVKSFDQEIGKLIEPEPIAADQDRLASTLTEKDAVTIKELVLPLSDNANSWQDQTEVVADQIIVRNSETGLKGVLVFFPTAKGESVSGSTSSNNINDPIGETKPLSQSISELPLADNIDRSVA